jgi:Xaa-Pro dipeptidase
MYAFELSMNSRWTIISPQDDRVGRATAAIAAAGADWALFTTPESVMRVAGVEPPLEIALPLFAGGPTTVLLSAHGARALVLTAREGRGADLADIDVVELYPGSSTTPFIDQTTGYVEAVQRALRRLRASGSLAIESRHIPHHTLWAAEPHFARVLAVDAEWEDACAEKTPTEIELLERAAEVVWAGQQAARRIAKPGMTELELFAEARAAMELAGGQRVPVTADLVTGVRCTAKGGALPTPRALRDGQPILIDLAARVRGYWGDSCDSFNIGEPSEPWLRLRRAAASGLQEGLNILRAGRRASDVDAEVRATVGACGGSYAHHTGHGIGARHHEEPRLIPHNPSRLRTGMVVTLEPGAYHEHTGGVRLECMAVVGPDGGRVLGPTPEGVAAN